MSSLSTGDVTSSSISLGLEASKKSSSSDSPEETNIAEVDVSRIMGGAKMEEDLSKLVLTEPVKFQGKYFKDALIKKMENQIFTNFLTILIVNDEKAIYYLDDVPKGRNLVSTPNIEEMRYFMYFRKKILAIIMEKFY